MAKLEKTQQENIDLKLKLSNKDKAIEEIQKLQSRKLREIKEETKFEYQDKLSKQKQALGEEILNEKEKVIRLTGQYETLVERHSNLKEERLALFNKTQDLESKLMHEKQQNLELK
jgi:chromosome segregation ATPase